MWGRELLRQLMFQLGVLLGLVGVGAQVLAEQQDELLGERAEGDVREGGYGVRRVARGSSAW